MDEFDAPSIKAILEIRREIRGGKFHPDSDSIRVYHAWLNDNFDQDVKKSCERVMLRTEEVEVLEIFKRLHFERSLENVIAAQDLLGDDGEMWYRMDVYRAFLGDPKAQIRELNRSLQRTDSSIEKARSIEWALGCLFVSREAGGVEIPLDVVIETGRHRMREIRRILAEISKETAADFFEAMAKAGAADADDEDGPFAPAEPAELPKLARRHIVSDAVIVVPPYAPPSSANKGDRHRVRAEFHVIAGQALPLVRTGEVLDHMSALSARAPHLADVYARLMTDTSQGEFARFSPTILVGEPGSGKSWSAREIGRTMGLPISIYSCGGVSDGSFGGTASHWSTSGASMPLSFILQCRKSNPLVVLDEIEKAGSSSHNGRLVDTLLAFLDRGNAQAYRDPALEITVDLSRVSYLLTANSLDAIPAPLRDRCRIITVPNPSAEHVPVLVRGILNDIALDRGIDRRWIEPLAQDEMEVVTRTWGEGSIRRLRRVVELFLHDRDRDLAGRSN